MECFKVGDEGAEAVMDRMKRVTGTGSNFLYLGNFGRGGDAGRSAEMMRCAEKSVPIPPRMFNAVLKAWAMSGDPKASERAKHVLDLLQENDKCVALGVTPSVDGFNSYLSCIAKSNQTDAGKESDAVISKMEELFSDGNANVRPDGSSFTIAIKTCLRCSDQVQQAAGKAHGISPEYLTRSIGLVKDRAAYDC
jgi:hypothetical protein